MKLPVKSRTLGIAAVLVPLLALFVYVAIRSGPLAPVAVTVETVEARALTPELFGIGTVEARFSYRIGPIAAGRLRNLLVDVGDTVSAGQVIGEMDPVDLDDRIRSQESVIERAESVWQDADARRQYATVEVRRYEQLLEARATSDEIVQARQQSLQVAEAASEVASADIARARSDRDMLLAQRRNLRLVVPVSGLVTARDVEPGTTVVAGQMVVEIVDPQSLWIHARFDQGHSDGLQEGLPARVVLRSRPGQPIDGRIQRVEPRADVVTEEMLAKIEFRSLPVPAPSIGELAEVNVSLTGLPAMPAIPNAAVQRLNGETGVWQIVDGDLRFTRVTLGSTDLEGFVQVRSGLGAGDRIVVYSDKALGAASRIKIVERLPGARP